MSSSRCASRLLGSGLLAFFSGDAGLICALVSRTLSTLADMAVIEKALDELW